MIYWAALSYLCMGAVVQYGVETQRRKHSRPVLDRHVDIIIWLGWFPIVVFGGLFLWLYGSDKEV